MKKKRKHTERGGRYEALAEGYKVFNSPLAELYSAAVRLWLAHPFLGVGAGNFELEISETGIYGVRTHANSWYLQSLVEGGIPLAAATLALVAVALTTFARRLRDG